MSARQTHQGRTMTAQVEHTSTDPREPITKLRPLIRKWSNHRDRDPTQRMYAQLINDVMRELETDPADERHKQMLESHVVTLHRERFGCDPDWAAGWNWVCGQRMALASD